MIKQTKLKIIITFHYIPVLKQIMYEQVLPWDLFTKVATYYCSYTCLSGTSSKVNGGLFV